MVFLAAVQCIFSWLCFGVKKKLRWIPKVTKTTFAIANNWTNVPLQSISCRCKSSTQVPESPPFYWSCCFFVTPNSISPLSPVQSFVLWRNYWNLTDCNVCFHKIIEMLDSEYADIKNNMDIDYDNDVYCHSYYSSKCNKLHLTCS